MSEVIEKPARIRATKLPIGVGPLTLGQACDALWQLREDKRELEAKVKAIDEQIKGNEKLKTTGLEGLIFGLLDGQDTRKAEGRRASVSIGEAVVANTEDWTEFMTFVAAGKRGDKGAYLHLVQKRVSDPAYRELLDLGIKVPGLVPFTKRTLNLRSL